MELELEETNNPMSRPRVASIDISRLRSVSGTKGGAEDMSVIDEWILRNSLPASTEFKNSWYEVHKDTPVDEKGCEELMFTADISTTLSHIVDDKSRVIHFVTNWPAFFNTITNGRTRNYFASEAPFLYLMVSFFFHGKTLRISRFVSLYLVLIEVIKFFAWPGRTLNMAASFTGLYIALHFSGKVIKGSKIAVNEGFDKSLRRETNPMNTIASKVPSCEEENLLQTLGAIWCTGSSLISNAASFVPKGLKMNKYGAVKINCFYDLAQTATAYLCTLRGDEKKFRPKAGTSFLLLALFLGGIIISVALFFYNWWYFFTECYGSSPFHNSADCSTTVFYNVVTLGCTITLVGCAFIFGTIFTGFAVLLYGADVANALTRQWITRISPFRTLSLENSHFLQSIDSLAEVVQRDTYERYLIMNYYMNSASDLWGGYLVVVIVCNIVLFVYGYSVLLWVYSNDDGRIDEVTVLSCIVNAGMFVFVMFCVSYANSAVDKVTKGFVYSAPTDFQILKSGEESGRRIWIDYVGEAPIYWYIFGFAITRPWLAGFVGGGISTLAGAALMVYFGLGG